MIEKNTVVLGIAEYNSLRDFQKNIDEGKVLVEQFKTYTQMSNGYNGQLMMVNVPVYKAKAEVIAEITEKVIEYDNRWKERSEVLQKEYDEYRANHTRRDVEVQTLTIDDVKNMSVKEFKKWKKEN